MAEEPISSQSEQPGNKRCLNSEKKDTRSTEAMNFSEMASTRWGKQRHPDGQTTSLSGEGKL